MKSLTRNLFTTLLLASGLTLFIAASHGAIAERPPNIILLLTDDLGYGDLSCYGSEFIDTPRIDQMARQGVRAKEYRTAANICTPSRAALLTGCYPQRAGIPNGISPARPEHRHLGLHPNEITIAEMLKDQGYATGMIGKWHLGFDAVFHPLNQGFDSYYGMPSNFNHDKRFFKDREVIAEITDLSMLTSNYTAKAVEFIQNNQDRPFFLYLAHNYPHVPLAPNPAYKGKSRAGDYGDIIEELDDSTGSILDTLSDLKIAEDTLIIFTSDNGPLPKFAQDYNSAGPLRGSKYVTLEGGHRVPAIFHWPSRLPSEQVCDVSISSMDVLPTIAAITGSVLPNDRTLDGKNIWPILMGESSDPPREIEYFYNDNNLQAIRKNDWKLHLPRTRDDIPWWHQNGDKEFKELAEPFLVNLTDDIGESRNVAASNAEIVNTLFAEAATARNVLGSAQAKGTGQREIGDSRKLAKSGEQSPPKPNIVLIFTDDQGYGDLSCFGGDHVHTPRIDRMAAEGAKLTSFYVAAAVCTPSRAALMTGSYPTRVNMAIGSRFGVLLSADSKGLNPDEITIAEVLKEAGYKTGIFGKWHLGDQPPFLPTRQGFDEYFGIPYSHDIHPYHPRQDHFQFPALPLLDQEVVIEMDPDADFLTQRVTERAIRFIEKNKDHPFFLYIPQPIPHKPLHVSPPYMKGVATEITGKLKDEGDSIDYKTRDLLFKQAIAEIDASVGEILDTLKEQGIDDETLVVFTSDNGPAVGSAGSLRGRKGSTYEGGMREATVVRWPGRIPAGQTNDALVTAMDLLPTFAKLAGAQIPADRIIDGKDIWPVLANNQKSPHEAFFYHRGDELLAVRSGNWKLHTKDGKAAELYNLDTDIGETKNVLKSHPDIENRLMVYMTNFAKNIAQNSRPAAFVENPKPLSK